MYTDHRRDKLHDPLHVVVAITNPWRYESRYRLFDRFAEHMEHSGAVLHVVECAFGDRDHAVAKANTPQHLQLRTDDELWHKENCLNVGISRLPSDWKYVAWLDADIEFVRKDWVNEVLHYLQHYHVVQVWSECIDMLPNHEINQFHVSFMKCYQDYIHGRLPEGVGLFGDAYYTPTNRGIYWHAGFGWAARREAIDHLGGLIDWSVCGANDHHMALALVGRLNKSIHGLASPGFKRSMDEWEARALKYLKKNIGYVPGTIMHNWHGAKTNRKYKDRWSIMTESQFDPNIDLKKDWQGLYQLTDRRGEKSVLLRDGLREYFRTRNEDSIDPYLPEKLVGPMIVPQTRTPLGVEPKTVEDVHDKK